jgi:hypothetical protein
MFKDLLEREGVSVYRLHQELAKQVSRTALYNWYQHPPKRLDFEVMVWVLWGLGGITGKTYSVADLLELSED